MFGGGGVSGASFGMFDDFDDFIQVLEKGNDKATRKMFRDLGRNCRPGAKNRKKGRGKAKGKKGKGDPFGFGGMGGIDIEIGGGKGMEEAMMAMMLGEMMSEAQYGEEEDMEEAMAKEFLNMDKHERKEMLQDMTK